MLPSDCLERRIIIMRFVFSAGRNRYTNCSPFCPSDKTKDSMYPHFSKMEIKFNELLSNRFWHLHSENKSTHDKSKRLLNEYIWNMKHSTTQHFHRSFPLTLLLLAWSDDRSPQYSQISNSNSCNSNFLQFEHFYDPPKRSTEFTVFEEWPSW